MPNREHETSLEEGLSERSKLIPLLLGPILALCLYYVLPSSYMGTQGEMVQFSDAARACTAMVLWMGIWWFTEPVPIAVTALLPIVLYPILGIATPADTLKNYANGTIFLFLGGFLIAAGIARWGLDRRIALVMIRIVGTKPKQIILGIMLATTLVSAWVSNTATAAMMLPIALALMGVVRSVRADQPIDQAERNFGVCLLLSIAYGASVGGVLTLIGTPPNGIFVRFVEQQYGDTVSFLDWLKISVPAMGLLFIATYVLLVKVLYRNQPDELPGGKEWVVSELHAMGKLSRGEWIVLIVFVLAALLWTFGPVLRGMEIGGAKPFKALSDTVIAMAAGIVLFIIPVDIKKGIHALDWSSASKGVAWDVLLLFGGGLTMAAAIQKTGAADAVGAAAVALGALPEWGILTGVTTLSVFVSEFTSNTALAATLMPLIAAVAQSLDMHPEALLICATMGTSCAFMMPVGTPPNAMVFGTGRLKISDMIRAGFWLNIISILIIKVTAYFFSPGLIASIKVPLG